MLYKISSFLLLLCLLIACQQQPAQDETVTKEQETVTPKKQRPLAFENGKFFEKDAVPMLFGGEQEQQHFNVSNLELQKEQFHYGIGRERFPALLQPRFTTVAAVDSLWKDEDRFLLAYAGEEVKAYSVEDLTRHEVVNDRLDGEPIMAVYCILADLGAIYSRQYGDQELTFALSGYTYFDEEVWDGLDGFVLWDRDTESLWWPLIGRAVSGPLKGVGLLEKDKANWEDTTWGHIKNNYPQAQVLISGQDYIRPSEWPQLTETEQLVAEFKQK
ncbi:MAG: DUF3179 domain-containing protein [Saprospiraceae bacterium]|nr:DUF3179 domain-containing protein [Saprospiraceae bacterium]